jgi:AcrR family transcriptional regulator
MSGVKTVRRKVHNSRSKQQVLSEFRRTEIIDAARTVFARRGFQAGIIDEIAKEARMAKGTVYLYFRSKSDIFKAVIDHDMRSLMQNTLDRIDAAATLREKIEAFALARLENAETRKELFQIMDSSHGNLAITRTQFRNWLREPVQHLAAAIQGAVERGEIRPVLPDKAAWSIADMTRGAIQRRLLGQIDSPLHEDAQFISTFVWSALQRPAQGRA